MRPADRALALAELLVFLCAPWLCVPLSPARFSQHITWGGNRVAGAMRPVGHNASAHRHAAESRLRRVERWQADHPRDWSARVQSTLTIMAFWYASVTRTYVLGFLASCSTSMHSCTKSH